MGVGKTAELKKENAELKAKNEQLREAFPKAVEKEVKKQTEPLIRERDAALRKADRDVMRSQIAVAEKDDYIKKLHRKLDMHAAVLRIFAEMLYAAGKVFKRAIDAIIDLATHTYKSFFDDSQAADIRSVMRQYGKTEEEKLAVGDWMCDYADTIETIERAGSRKTRTEVMEIAEGRYDQIIDQGRGSGMSR